eukprot:CAMPEP_0114237080 /NCGR_PEP_ID=MMETSP0058-20121206/7194_1 /TAXON_ID=36894 /ORGANISM="Pyramimonas parkeae, CCMP726" /LENGTH=31 /DNA_ID= /DNA_START= /DNA_END= /DNA_ORIENTATION=
MNYAIDVGSGCVPELRVWIGYAKGSADVFVL